MNCLRQILAGLLILTLGFAIIPPESFHHHEESHVICKKGQIHVELKRFECELHNFVLPILIQDNKQTDFLSDFTGAFFLVQNTRSAFGVFLLNLFYRGPPHFEV